MTTYSAITASALGNVSMFNDLQMVLDPASNADRAILINTTTATRTYLWSAVIGGNLTYSGGAITGGTIHWITRTDVAGAEFETVGSALANINIDGASFWNAGSNQNRFNLVFSGADTLSGSGAVTHQTLGGSTGADTFIGLNNNGNLEDRVSYIFSTGGVTVDLGNPSHNTGEAAGDTYTNIIWIEGSTFSDVLIGNSDRGFMFGGEGGDTIDGGDGGDFLEGNSGNDSMFAGAGDDWLDGGDGTSDTIDFTGASNGLFGIDVTLSASGGGSVTFTGTGFDEFIRFENVVGTALVDSITGNAADNVLTGLDGNDALYGSGGNDSLDGGNGDDFLRGGNGNDSVQGSGGGDIMSFLDPAATSGLVMILGATGSGTVTVSGLGTDNYSGIEGIEGTDLSDSIIGNDVANTLYGAGGRDFLLGKAGNDVIAGGAGDDILTGGEGDDSIFGGDQLGDSGSSDTIVFSDANAGISITLNATGNGVVNLVAAGLGTDTYAGIENVTGGEFNDTIYSNGVDNILDGRGGNDDLRSFGGNDTLYGGIGNDYLQAGTGNNLVDGGDGDDMLSFYDFAAGVTFTLAEGGDGPLAGVDVMGNVYSYYSIEALSGSDYGFAQGLAATIAGDNLSGNSSNNRIWGFWGNDVLSGLAGIDSIEGGFGDDTLIGGLGTDSLQGDDGSDTASYINSTIGLVVSLASPGNNTGEAAGDIFISIENLIGSDFADHLSGDGFANVLTGGRGTDTLAGGSGDDTYYIETYLDIVAENANQGTDTVVSTSSYIMAANVENLTLVMGAGLIDGLGNAENNIITGNDSRNGITGGGGNDTIIGNGGDDAIDGGIGADSMIGGSGVDTYYVDNAGDAVVETEVGATLYDTVWTNLANYTLPDNVEIYISINNSGSINGTGNDLTTLMLGNEGDNILNSLGGNDIILGRDGNDTINSGAGGDPSGYEVISGGVGADSLTGGGGHDFFNYELITHGGDIITDFQTNAGIEDDILDFRPMFPTFTNTAGITTSAQAVASGHLTYVQSGANVQVFADANGGAHAPGEQVLMATLLNQTAASVQTYTLI